MQSAGSVIDDPAATRLASYGTLAPGQPNHHQLAGLRGTWRTGTVRGRLLDEDWVKAFGYPLLVLDEDAPAVPVALFESDDLVAHWTRLDAFEGAEYRRVETIVEVEGGSVAASIYVAAGITAATAAPFRPGEPEPAP